MIRKKYKIGICGGFDNTIINGQALRTISITDKVIELIGEQNVKVVKYANWRKRPIRLLLEFISLIFTSESLILCPDEIAIRFIFPICSFFSKFTKVKLFYVVIGGWLPCFLEKHRILKNELKRINGLFVQTEVLKSQLDKIDIKNVFILPNFRNYILNDEHVSIERTSEHVKTFFMSRIEDLKGISEMIDVINSVHSKGYSCELDIYGSIMPEYKSTFERLSLNFPEYIHYCGELKPYDINKTIWVYDLQLFPTKYKTEGFPGSILDSFYAGIPTLSACWNSGKEVINDRVDGLLFEQYNYVDMENKLISLIENTDFLNSLKRGARIRRNQYNPNTIISSMLETIDKN